MEAPPQFPGAPKKSKTGCILGGVALAIVLCCCGGGGAALYFGKGFLGKAFDMVGCGIAIGLQRDGLIEYAKAHGGKLPAAGTWQDDIKPYVRSLDRSGRDEQPFTIPSVADDFCDRQGRTVIAYNAGIAGKKVADIKSPYETIALFEISGRGRNLNQAYKEQPFETSPKFVSDQRRGWIRVPVKGEASSRDRNGRIVPMRGMSGGNGASFGPVDVQTRESSGE